MGDDVGLVVAGAGARGAYEAGALTVLIPRMIDDGAPPRVLVGTSAGALNVVGLAGCAAWGWDGAADGLVDLWSEVRLGEVVNLVSSVVTGLGGYAGQVLGLPVSLPSLLDTEPQRRLLTRLLPLDALHKAIDDGDLDAVAVAATSASTGGSVVFVEKGPGVPLPPFDPKRNITYIRTRLTVEHVLASIAVPVAFRPVRVHRPARAAGWYVDGGVRLNTPIKPALELGCSRLGLVATHPTRPGPPAPTAGAAPDVFRSTAMVLQALLADRMVEDLHTLAHVNRLVEAVGAADASSQKVPFLFAGPPPGEAGALGALANEVFEAEYGGLRGARNLPLWLLERFLGGDPASHGELLSFFLFDPAFTGPAAALGARHAEATLAPVADAAAPAWPTSASPPST